VTRKGRLPTVTTETIVVPRIVCATLTMVPAFIVYRDRSSARTRLTVYAMEIVAARPAEPGK